MLDLETLKEKLKIILENNIGNTEIEDTLLEIQSDYEEFQNVSRETSEDYKSKYEELHQKYIDRFFGGSEESGECEPEEIGECEPEEIEEKEINDLFKESE